MKTIVFTRHAGSGVLIDANDTQADTLESSGLAPTNDRDAKLMVSLPPGDYTTVVRGKHGATGVALVELYRIR